jgi:hypothetical protein
VIVRGEFGGTFSTESSTSDDAATSAQLEAASHRPFQLEFDDDGQFRRASGEPGTPPFIGRMWTALGEYVQVPIADVEQAREAREHDASGEYVASYESRGAGQISKRKLRYQKLTAKALLSYDIVSSEGQLRIDDEGELLSFEMSESTRAALGSGPLPGFAGETKLVLSRTNTATELASVAAPLGSAIPFDEVAHEQNDAARDAQKIGGMSVAQTLTDLKGYDHAAGNKDEQKKAGKAFVALTALLRRDPSALVAVRANLKKGGTLTVALLAALRDASTPDSQKLLSEMSSASRSPLNDEDRLEAVRSLSRVSIPTADTVEALKALRGDPIVGTQATYGLGTALHHLQDQDPDLSRDVRTTLTQQISSASDSSSQAAVLTALGNAGDPSTLDTVRRFVVSPDPQVRSAAAQALRRIAGPEVDGLLAQLCADPVPDVRYSATDAISERPSAAVLIAALSPLALNEPTLPVRTKAVNILAQWYQTAPALAATLQAVASNDSNADLRNVAKHALGQG